MPEIAGRGPLCRKLDLSRASRHRLLPERLRRRKLLGQRRKRPSLLIGVELMLGEQDRTEPGILEADAIAGAVGRKLGAGRKAVFQEPDEAGGACGPSEWLIIACVIGAGIEIVVVAAICQPTNRGMTRICFEYGRGIGEHNREDRRPAIPEGFPDRSLYVAILRDVNPEHLRAEPFFLADETGMAAMAEDLDNRQFPASP